MADEGSGLYEVLAEEYVRLHGALPEEVEAAGDDTQKLKALYTAIHKLVDKGQPRSALSLSGGGIRSATFALGVIQRLAHTKVLSKFDYLSTVSGGGYIGGWLSSYARRNPQGMAGVAEDIDGRPAAGRDPLKPEVDPLTWLREFSNYLTPKLGLLTGDTWAFAGSYLRNLLLNWLMFIPVLISALSLPRLAIALLHLEHNGSNIPEIYAVIGGVLILIATCVIAVTRPVSYKEEGWLTNARFQRFVLIPYFVAAILLVLYWAARATVLQDWKHVMWGFIGISAFASAWYMVRFYFNSQRERRGNIRSDSTVQYYFAKKLAAELIAAAVAGATAPGLLAICAKELFDDPMKRVVLPQLADWQRIPPTLSTANGEFFLCFGVPLVLGILFIQAAIFVGGCSWFNEEYDREWWGRAAGWVLVVALVWMGGTAITIYGPVAIYQAPKLFAAIGGASGLFSILTGKSGKTAASSDGDKQSTSGNAMNLVLGIVAPLFAVCVLALIALCTSNILLDMKNPPDRMGPDAVALAEKASHQIQYRQILEQGAGNYQTERFPAIDSAKLHALEHLWTVDQTTALEGVVLVFGFALFGWGVSFFIGANQFSMHGLYRNRLIRAYLGASRFVRHANRFSGFDPNDNMPMHRLRPETFWGTTFNDIGNFGAALEQDGELKPHIEERTWAALKEVAQKPTDHDACMRAGDVLSDDLNRAIDKLDLDPKNKSLPRSMRNRLVIENRYPKFVQKLANHARPMHIVNTTLNLVATPNLAWQQRKAECFTVSPIYSGSFRLSYRPTREYGGPSGVSLGTAVAISGAAASPNMGYNSSPALSFLLTLFNVRLGWWYGNPNKSRWRDRNPSNTLKTFLDEAFGATDDQHPSIYLSDGGHFENLALYEMVLRRCHCIVLSDAAGDPQFNLDDLGNAIRKIRIDFGIRITIDHEFMLYPRPESPENAKYCAIATIHYKDVDGETAPAGKLLYLKPAFYGSKEPKDVYNYARTSASFPHETTGDQWFSESQFESYRALGYFTLSEVTGDADHFDSVCELVDAASRYVNTGRPVTESAT